MTAGWDTGLACAGGGGERDRGGTHATTLVLVVAQYHVALRRARAALGSGVRRGRRRCRWASRDAPAASHLRQLAPRCRKRRRLHDRAVQHQHGLPHRPHRAARGGRRRRVPRDPTVPTRTSARRALRCVLRSRWWRTRHYAGRHRLHRAQPLVARDRTVRVDPRAVRRRAEFPRRAIVAWGPAPVDRLAVAHGPAAGAVASPRSVRGRRAAGDRRSSSSRTDRDDCSSSGTRRSSPGSGESPSPA